MSDSIQFRSFPASPVDPQCRNWLRAVQMGFYEDRAKDEHLSASLTGAQADGRIFTGAYDPEQGQSALSVDVPVATYATMQHSLNTGAGYLLPTHQITSVTVRPTHRRRGLLRSLITADLVRAREKGLSLAALTASEAVIYGRFGFGAATFLRTVEITTDARFSIPAEQTGRVELTDPENLATWGPEIFERFHAATSGSLDRQYRYAKSMSGIWNQKYEPDLAIRTAVYISDDGSRDGYVSYRFEGWDAPTPTVQVEDIVAVTDEAYRELWRFLGSLDLVKLVKFDTAALNDPLPWLLSDRRVYSIKAEGDHLWLRVLDTVKALESRHWAHSGVLTLKVHDPLGLADGTFRVEAADGGSRVQEVSGSGSAGPVADVEVDAYALAALYLGGVGNPVGALVAAGSIRECRSGAADELERLFAPSRTPYCITGF